MSSRRLLPSLLLVLAAPAAAQIANPGFETPVTPAGSSTTLGGGSTIGAWTVVGPNVLLLNTTYTEPNGVGGATLTFNAHSGSNSVDLTGASNVGITAGVQQSIATLVGTSYDLSFWVGRATGNGFYAVASTVDVSVDGGARVSFTNSNSTANAIDWQQFTYTFVATNASTQLTFYNGTSSTANNLVGLDDVAIAPTATAAPEPATLALVSGGLLVLGGAARRRRRATA